MTSRLEPGEAATPPPQKSVRFVLDDAVFLRWWNTALLPEDASEFVHFFRGSRDGARLVCAVDYLKSTSPNVIGGDLIVRAYCISKALPVPESERNPRVRTEAQLLWEDDATQSLHARVVYRSKQESLERIARLTTSAIEDLHERASDPENPKRASDLRLALEYGTRLLTSSAQDTRAEQNRRDRKAIVAAMKANEQKAHTVDALPSVEEARLHLRMLSEQLPADEYAQLLSDASRKALEPGTQ